MMEELYQELIMDHGKNPRNFRVMDDADVIKEGFNPLCGDQITLYLKFENDMVVDASFSGSGCAISTASSSLMTQAVKGKSITEVEALFKDFQALAKGESDNADNLGKLVALAGVKQYPMRVKCATLAWHTLLAGVHGDNDEISTE